MKIAEALAKRKDLTTKIADLERRAKAAATVQEGQTPSEDAASLALDVQARTMELMALVKQINSANVRQLEGEADGMNLADLIVERDHLRKLSQFYRAFAEAGTQTVDRYSRSEIAIVSLISVGENLSLADAYSEQARALDLKIQRLDWQIDL